MRTPKEYNPSREYTAADALEKPDLWNVRLMVLEQEFLPIKTGKTVQPGKFVVGRRQKEPYECSSEDWLEMGGRLKRETEELMVQKLGEGEPKFQLNMSSARQHFWDSRRYQVCAAYGADIPQSAMRKDLKVKFYT